MSMNTRHLSGWLRSPRTWIAAGILVPVGMVAVCSVMLLELRQDAWEKAEQTSKNLLRVIERDIDRNIEIIDVALQSVVENLKMYDLEEISAKYRQRILFDRAVNAKDLDTLLVLDQHGNCIYDAAGWPARQFNNADRAYFKAHQTDPELGLGISQPIISRSVGKPVIVLSRRTGMTGGSFSGIVLGSLSLSYFDRLFDQIDLGKLGTISLFLKDGTRIVRYPQRDPGPPPNFADAPHFRKIQREGRGSLVAVSPTDGVERLYTFTNVGRLPLILTIALSTTEIETEWRSKALVIGALIIVLCAVAVGLSFLVACELKQRSAVEAELSGQSRTDALTGLPNRRAFEEIFEQAWAAGRRRGAPLTLLVIDADHFKRYNDRYGHAGGDRVLQALGGALTSCARWAGALVARIGGEEFAILLPDTDAEDAAHVAEAVHAAVVSLAVVMDGMDVGRITVSIGLGFALPHQGGTPADLFRLADAALYEAKAAGRNRTQYVVMGEIDASGPEIRSGSIAALSAECSKSKPVSLVA
jgi:diguanylate cyclase (GGDEF)-like protein